MSQQPERELQPGEPVAWNYGAGQARGHVVEKLTEDKKIGSRVFKASPDDPKYVVKNESSGKEAVRKPETLHKLDEDGEADTTDGGDDAKSDGEDVKCEVGAKEKREDLNARSSTEERQEVEDEESLKKVQDIGKGSVRASTETLPNQVENAPTAGDAQVDVDAGHEDLTCESDKNTLQSQNNEEVRKTVLREEEARKEGAEISDGMESTGGVANVSAGHAEAINQLPSDEAPLRHVEREKMDAGAEATDAEH